ncbi:I78 family peptidase inhibitor [Phyllobacterium sp. SB3]|uniref:I78 family peptidase inhibitor n=1 Tax=Phyllobacterium sp. SB3 TaxID=3156073 RepID=UPI0032AF252E
MDKMIEHRFLTTTAAFFFSLGLVACADHRNTGNGSSHAARCNPVAAKTLVGRSALTEDEVKLLTGAVTIRRISPGDMVTQDYRQDRLTTEVDDHGIVTRATCG